MHAAPWQGSSTATVEPDSLSPESWQAPEPVLVTEAVHSAGSPHSVRGQGTSTSHVRPEPSVQRTRHVPAGVGETVTSQAEADERASSAWRNEPSQPKPAAAASDERSRSFKIVTSFVR